jgi:uncharacterized protein (TIGR00251 family)
VDDPPFSLTAHGEGGCAFRVRAQPGASRERIVGVHGDALKIAVAAPPERGRANERIAALLAAALQVSPRVVDLLAGAASRDKRFAIHGLTPEECHARLAPFLES